jgi:hypothetical protein
MKKLLLAVLGFIAAYVLIGVLVDRIIFPEAEPAAEYYPPEGYVFVSKSEGFRQTILKRENGLFWLELVLEPNAPGPPVFLQKALFFVTGPAARMPGYRTHYEKYKPAG